MLEVLLGVEPFPQPSPARNPGGDCFACALTAALRWLYPERPITFEEAWQLFVGQQSGHLSNTWPGMRDALYGARSLGYDLEVTNDLVEPHYDVDTWSHAWWTHFPTQRYAHRLEGWLRGGWVAFTEIDFQGRGPVTSSGHLNSTDHFVLLDGLRAYWKPHEDVSGAALTHEVHVVCSVRGAYWIALRDFLRCHGGAGWWLCRRDLR